MGALGTALFDSKPKRPRVLLIDEMDKIDIDLPNDLLNIFEEGEFEIPELTRIADAQNQEDKNQLSEITVKTCDNQSATIIKGKVKSEEFPFVILTSNGEREFPPAFLRRCLRLDLREPTPKELEKIVAAHLKESKIIEKSQKIIDNFVNRRNKGDLATDQLLNAIYMLTNTANKSDSPMLDLGDNEESQDAKTKLVEHLLRYLNNRD